jgi:uncharacterized protein (DUF1697 family)
MAATERVVALLRGINVGGHHKLPMADLRSVLEGAGCTDVETYIQSGNVVAALPAAGRRDGAAWLSQVISSASGFEVPVVVRTAKEFERIAMDTEFDTTKSTFVHAMFFADARSAEEYAAIDIGPYEPERLVIRGNTLLFWLPNGLGRSPLVIDLERRAKRERLELGTMRNWNTVTKLAEMGASLSPARRRSPRRAP